MEIKIEKGIPIPTRISRGLSSYPYSKMNIGDSFLLNLKKGKKFNHYKRKFFRLLQRGRQEIKKSGNLQHTRQIMEYVYGE